MSLDQTPSTSPLRTLFFHPSAGLHLQAMLRGLIKQYRQILLAETMGGRHSERFSSSDSVLEILDYDPRECSSISGLAQETK